MLEIPHGNFRWDIGVGEEDNGTERKITNLEDSEILRQMSWLTMSKTADIRSSEVGTCTIYFSAGLSNAALLFRTMNSAKDLSIYRATKDWCDELTQQIPGQSASSMEKSNVKVTER